MSSATDLLISGTQGVSSCSSATFSPARVSSLSAPHASTLAQLPCTHLRAEIRSVLTYSTKRSCARSHVLPQEQFDARDGHKAKLQTARRRRIESTTATMIYSVGHAALEISKVLETRRSMRTSRAPVCGQASARPARGSLGGSSAASSAATAAPPSVSTSRAIQLTPERVE